ncbi:hypothetical protein ANO14919_000010 [Xylariales sp. No.14919]|nr:hypothetical protein ANO14919_000010 [Xylariales sp. No.14919]
MSSHVRLQDVLRDIAQMKSARRAIFYRDEDTSGPTVMTYSELYHAAAKVSQHVKHLEGFERGCPVLLHLEDHLDFVLWFWAVLLADGLPVASPPLSTDVAHRYLHLKHLCTLLDSPLCFTRRKSIVQFGGSHNLRIHTIESLLEATPHSLPLNLNGGECKFEDRDLALLMLTSGSTGNAKAVRLCHSQILAAIDAKAAVRQLPDDTAFLNWIGLDHVASLLEIHIQALRLGLDQVHVPAVDIISCPKRFLELLSNHRVSRTFAPNFFLAKLVTETEQCQDEYDLSSLRVLASGGEANDVHTCLAASKLLERHGAPPNAITPGFGMTETCAGAIFNLNCPRYDIQNSLIFTSLGQCLKGLEMRINLSDIGNEVEIAPTEAPGNLEVRGTVVFDGYYNNRDATASVFTRDGWFRTGDLGVLDHSGFLRLTGRATDFININGLKVGCEDLQSSIASSVGDQVRRLIVFPSRKECDSTETPTVAFVPRTWPMETESMVDIHTRVTEACIISSGSRPLIFYVPDESLLPTSTLGKVSRARMRSLFETGVLDDYASDYISTMDSFRLKSITLPQSESEFRILEDVAEVLNVQTNMIGTTTPFLDLGFNSMTLIHLKRRIDRRLQVDIPIITIMRNPTARLLASNIQSIQSGINPKNLSSDSTYDPVVVFRSNGNGTPLWLVHPGVGEVLVFVGLAKQLADDDRPIYALRARGFDEGQSPFESISETVDTYQASIRRYQTSGPYALAGYSYGTMIAFEIAKALENEEKGSVHFLGSFNLPPHIKQRMRQFDWNLCLLHCSVT